MTEELLIDRLLSKLVEALRATTTFEQAAGATLRPMLALTARSLAASPFASTGRVVRGMLHLRPDDGYQRLVVLEDGASAVSAPGSTADSPAFGDGVALGRRAPARDRGRRRPRSRRTRPEPPEPRALRSALWRRRVREPGEPRAPDAARRLPPLRRPPPGAARGALRDDLPRGPVPRGHGAPVRVGRLRRAPAAPRRSREPLPREPPRRACQGARAPTRSSRSSARRWRRSSRCSTSSSSRTTRSSSADRPAPENRALPAGATSAPAFARGPFEMLDLSSLPEELQLAELFGWKKGAFTGAVRDNPGVIARAKGGTLFLDEIDNLSLRAQAGLLHVLEERSYRVLGDEGGERPADVRFIVGTNARLQDAVREKRFREDLVLPNQRPPREAPGAPRTARRDHAVGAVHGEPVPREARARGARDSLAEGRAALVAQAWPGNLRQLDNVVRRACAMAHHGPRRGGASRSRDRGRPRAKGARVRRHGGARVLARRVRSSPRPPRSSTKRRSAPAPRRSIWT